MPLTYSSFPSQRNRLKEPHTFGGRLADDAFVFLFFLEAEGPDGGLDGGPEGEGESEEGAVMLLPILVTPGSAALCWPFERQ